MRQAGSLSPRRLVILALAAFALVPGAAPESSTLSPDQAAVLAAARKYALAYTATLPDFTCTQITHRDSARANIDSPESGAGGRFNGAADDIVERVTFIGERESYEVLSINNKPVTLTHAQIAGAMSIGEFGSAARAVFDPRFRAVFRWHGETRLHGIRTYVFAYQMPREAGMPVSDGASGRQVVAPYGGQVFIDAMTHEVLRITSHLDLPRGFSIERADRAVDYGPVFIAGKRYILPLHSELTMVRGAATYLNKIEFRDYHKFEVEATIRMGALPDSVTPQPPLSTPAAAEARPAAEAASDARATESAVKAVSPAEPLPQAVAPATIQPPIQIPQPATQPPKPAANSAPAVAAPSAVAAQPADVESRYLLQTNTNLVLVPVVVRDAAGNAVANLTRDDFEIFDKGKRQPIASFSIETQNVSAENGEGGGGSAQQGAVASQNISSYIVFLFDDIHLGGDDLARLEEAAEHQAASLQPGDLAAVVTTSDTITSPMTADRRKLIDAIRQVRSQRTGGPAGCPAMTYFMADTILNHRDSGELLQAMTVETVACLALPGRTLQEAQTIALQTAHSVAARGEEQTRRVLLQIRDVVRWLFKAPGKRRIILVSPGFYLDGGALMDTAQVADEAIRDEVVIDSLDARGVYGQNPAGKIEDKAYDPAVTRMKVAAANQEALADADILGQLAADTGGAFLRNTNDFDGAFHRLTAVPQYTYVLGFKPAKLDGHFHPLKVKLDGRKNLAVQARQEYFATKP